MHNAKYWTLFFFFLPVAYLGAQCGLTVDAGPDLTICGLGNTGVLNGTVFGNYTSFQWTPAAGLSNPNSLTPTASAPGVYTFTATGPSNINLVANGDFEAGAVGFSSDYTLNPIPILNGTYTAVVSPQLVVSSFPPCDDHTFGDGTGQMLLVNGDGTPGENVWCQTVPVTPNSNYDLSAWVSTLIPIGLAQLQFAVNGQLIGGTASPSATPCDWVPFSATWNSGASTTATVCIVTQSTNGFGNDFVLDDIEMYGECQVTDEALVDVLLEPVVNVQAYRCLGDCFFIGSTPYCGSGNYSQSIPAANGCDSTVNLQLTVLEAIPFVLPPDTLSCYNDFTVELDASPSTSGPFTTYSWSGPNGFSSSLQNPVVSSPGAYTLELTSSAGGLACSNTATVMVTELANQAAADAGPNVELGCGASAATLDGSNSDVGTHVVYGWNGPSGFSSEDISPTVEETGAYVLEALDTLSGCSTLDTALVNLGGDSLSLSLSADTLSCAKSVATLTAVPDSAAVQFEWSGPNGFIDTLPSVQTAVPGWYTFSQTDSTGCSASDSISVEADTLLPAFDLHTAMLSCDQPTDSIMVVGLMAYDTLWWTGPSDFSSPAQAVVVDSAGVYRLHVVGANGCLAQDSVLVTSNFAAPDINAAGAVLDCGEVAVTISATATDTVLQWLWTGPDGFSANGDTVLASFTGVYTLTATGTNGCTATDTALVQAGTGLPQLTAVGDTINCLDPTAYLSGSATVGASLDWSGPNGFSTLESNPTVTRPGSYTLTATLGANCTVDTTVTVAIDTLPPLLSGQPDTINCTQPLATLQPSDSAASPNYFWSGPDGFSSTLPSVEVSAGGTYQVRVESANGCSDSLSLEVVVDTLVPSIQLAADTLSCTNPVANLTANAPAADRFEWAGPNGFSSLSQNTATAQHGVYTLSATAANGCTATDSITVTGDQLPPQVTVASDTLNCSQPAVTLVAESGLPVAYGWSGPGGFSSTSPNPTVDQPGTYILEAEAANGCRDTVRVEVAVDTLPPSLQLAADTLTCSTTAATLMATAADAQILSWTGPAGFSAAAPTVVVGTSGWYTLTATAGNGCSNQDSIQVIADQISPDLAAEGGTFNCTTPTASLQSATNVEVTYLWSGPNAYTSDEAQPSVSAAGQYVLTVTAANGCSAVDTAVVVADTIAPVLQLTADTLTCEQQQIPLSVVASATDLAYDWSGPEAFASTSAEPLVADAGLYKLTATAPNGCRQTDSVFVVADTVLPQLQARADTLTCANPLASLTGSSDGVGDLLSWTGPNGFAQAGSQTTAAQAGTYTFCATAANGCRDSLLIEVQIDTVAPQLMAEALRLDCRQAAAPLPATLLSNTTAEFRWSGPGGFSATVLQPTVQAGGAYQLIATQARNGCEDSVTLIVSLDTLRPMVDVLAAGELSCRVDTVDLIGTGSAGGAALAFTWSTNDGAFGESPLRANTSATAPGQYLLTVEHLENGCTASDSVQVLENTAKPVDIGLVVTPPYCADGTGSARVVSVEGGTPPYVYALGGGSFSAVDTFTQLAPGTYPLEVEDANGCRSMQSFVVPTPLPLTLSLPAEIELHFSESLQLMPVLNFPTSIISGVQWSPADYLSCIDCLQPILQQPAEGIIYSLTIVTAEGCEVSGEVQIKVLKDRAVYVPNAFSPGNADGRNDYFTVYAADQKVEKVNRLAVFDRWGGQVFDRRDFPPNTHTQGWDGSYRGEAAASGVYVYWAEVEFVDGRTVRLKGEVLLLR